MQASRSWSPPRGVLGDILAATRTRLEAVQPLPAVVGGSRPLFSKALHGSSVAVIAELKRKSPSRGVLDDTLGTERARGYADAGASALSILTEPSYFGGSLDDLRAVAGAVSVPLLRKDFHVDPSQLAEARAAGASAALLIARALGPGHLDEMVAAARDANVEALVEVRDEEELERALAADAQIIGVNSRDLETLEVDESVPARMIPLIPRERIAIWESGIATRADVERAARAGVDAVLVGSALSLARDPDTLLAQITGVKRLERND